MSIALGFAVFGLLLVTVLLIQRIQQKNDLLRSMLGALQEAKTREWTTNQLVEHILVQLAPLLSQTDWITGRWGGKLDQLVEMESARNRDVVAIRSSLFSLPFLKEYFGENKLDLLLGVTQTAFTGIESK